MKGIPTEKKMVFWPFSSWLYKSSRQNEIKVWVHFSAKLYAIYVWFSHDTHSPLICGTPCIFQKKFMLTFPLWLSCLVISRWEWSSMGSTNTVDFICLSVQVGWGRRHSLWKEPGEWGDVWEGWQNPGSRWANVDGMIMVIEQAKQLWSGEKRKGEWARQGWVVVMRAVSQKQSPAGPHFSDWGHFYYQEGLAYIYISLINLNLSLFFMMCVLTW